MSDPDIPVVELFKPPRAGSRRSSMASSSSGGADESSAPPTIPYGIQAAQAGVQSSPSKAVPKADVQATAAEAPATAGGLKNLLRRTRSHSANQVLMSKVNTDLEVDMVSQKKRSSFRFRRGANLGTPEKSLSSSASPLRQSTSASTLRAAQLGSSNSASQSPSAAEPKQSLLTRARMFGGSLRMNRRSQIGDAAASAGDNSSTPPRSKRGSSIASTAQTKASHDSLSPNTSNSSASKFALWTESQPRRSSVTIDVRQGDEDGPLGFSDLEENELRVLRNLAVQQLSTILGRTIKPPRDRMFRKDNSIRAFFRSDSPSKSAAKKRLFGLPLEKALEHDQMILSSNGAPGDSPRLRVPLLVSSCIARIDQDGLHLSGIYRVSGSAKRMKDIEMDFDAGELINVSTYKCHDLASLLKHYLRALPEPLLTYDLYDSFIAALALEDPLLRARTFNLLVALVPIAHLDVLEMLVRHMVRVAAMSKEARKPDGTPVEGNHMDSNNLALMFGPNVLRRPKNKTSVSLESGDMTESLKVIDCVRVLIDNYKTVFTVRLDMLKFVAQKLGPSNSKLGRRRLDRQGSTESRKRVAISAVEVREVEVHSPHLERKKEKPSLFEMAAAARETVGDSGVGDDYTPEDDEVGKTDDSVDDGNETDDDPVGNDSTDFEELVETEI